MTRRRTDPEQGGERVHDAYLDHLRVERGLAQNSLEAYGRDVRRLRAFAERKRRTILALTQADVVEFLSSLRNEGLGPRSVARTLHAVRGLYWFAGVGGDHTAGDLGKTGRARRGFGPVPRFGSARQV